MGTTKNPSPKIKVPKNSQENRTLKEGLIEDDNDDIAYLNFQLIWPVSAMSLVSVFFMALAVSTMEVLPHLEGSPTAGVRVATYGRVATLCNNTNPFEDGMYPSILRQAEMKVTVNVFFRVSVCVPMAIRIFLAMVIRNSFRDEYLCATKSDFLWFLNELTTVLSAVEALCLALFSIITIRFDYPDVYRYSFCTFIFSTIMHMYLRTILSFTTTENTIKLLDKISMSVKCVSAIIFSWMASQFFYFHQDFIGHVTCHGYVHYWNAINEYCLILAYLFFNLTFIIDIRDLRFICYPRTSSGEC
uniref:CWH43-like N-terminal domain-containing protein n=1 Tax=Acrobeloides nanus TaxID=290746 RepID=A0A914D6G7_9BILA